MIDFLTFSCVFCVISISSIKKTLWESLFYENIQKLLKTIKLILACMRRSKHVQSAWILVILINLTHFFVYFLLFMKKMFKKPLCINIFRKTKKQKKTFTLVLACCPSLKITNLPDFRWNFQNFVTDSIPKESFYFFSQKNISW